MKAAKLSHRNIRMVDEFWDSCSKEVRTNRKAKPCAVLHCPAPTPRVQNCAERAFKSPILFFSRAFLLPSLPTVAPISSCRTDNAEEPWTQVGGAAAPAPSPLRQQGAPPAGIRPQQGPSSGGCATPGIHLQAPSPRCCAHDGIQSQQAPSYRGA
jgi:hypothetical protein